jgi:putative transposase
MSSYRQHLYHIVTRTKNSRPTIAKENSDKLFAYITGIIKNKDSFPYRINGVKDHIHILTDIHPSLAPADFVKDVKVYSSLWIKKSGLFPRWEGWEDGYASLTCSYCDLDRLIAYIKNQQEHHKKESFEEEYKRMLEDAGIKIDFRYFP